MAFDPRYPNRKDHRRPYRGAKAVDPHCRNHGACECCKREREYKAKRREPVE